MTVQTTTARGGPYSTNGTTGPWTVPFYFLADADISVVYTDSAGTATELTLSTHYTATGAGDESGGTVTTVTAYAAGGTITILRGVDALQPSDYSDTDAFPAATLERNLDRLTMLAQQTLEVADRSIAMPAGFDGDATMPGEDARAGRLLAFAVADGAPGVSSFTSAQVAAAIAAIAPGGDGGSVLSREVQTATADQTVFTLATMTYTPGVNALLVVIDGAVMPASDYTETSTSVVTMDSGVPVGAEVEFLAVRFVTSGVDGDEVSVLLPDTGALGRSLTDILADDKTINSYIGADPTGATDSSAAAASYQTWIEANYIDVVPAGAYPMKFPPGRYQLDAQNFTKNGTIRGAGSRSTFVTLKAGETAPLFTFNATDYATQSTDDTDHFTVEGVRLFGNRVDGTTTGVAHAISCPDASFAMGTQYAPSVRMSDVVIEGFTGHGIFLGVNRNWALIDRVICRYCNDSGLASYGFDHRIVSSDFGLHKNYGIRLFAGGGVTMLGVNTYYNTINVVLNNSVGAYVWMIGCDNAGAAEHGLSVAGATGVVRVMGGRFQSNSRTTANTSSDILVAGSGCIVGIDGAEFTLGTQATKHLLETSGSPTILWGENEYLTSGSVPYGTSVTNDWTLLRYTGARDAYIGSAGAATLAAYTGGAERMKIADANTTFNHPVLAKSYTVAGLPAAASHTAGVAYCSNETGGAVLVFSDGTNWRRVTDRAIAS